MAEIVGGYLGLPATASNPQASPIPWGEVQGGDVTNVSGLTFNVTAFRTRDQSNQMNIISSGTTAMDLATDGPGGKDYPGATLSSTLAHCLYAISNDDGSLVSCIASLNWTAPTLPALPPDYTKYVCIGFVAPSSTTVLHPEYRSGELYMYDYTLGTIPQNAETLLSIGSFCNFASSRFTGAHVEVRNTTNVGGAFCAIRRISGGTNWLETASGLQSRYEGIVPLSGDSIVTFSSALLQTGTARLKGIYFIRGAK